MFTVLFPHHKPIIGMIHVGALPGTPAHTQGMAELIAQAVREAQLYRAGGVDAVMIENMHDVPYLRGAVGPEIVAAMTLVGHAVKRESALPCGMQILAGANTAALAVAHAAGLDFIRVEGYASNLADFYPTCDALIVGSYFKRDGHWAGPVEPGRIEAFMSSVRALRQ